MAFLHLAGVLLVSLCWGLGGPISWFASQELSFLEVTFGRCFFAFLGLSPFFFLEGRKILSRLPTSGKSLLLLSGFVLGIHFSFFVGGIAYASLATAVLLVAAEPVVVLMVGVFGFKEKLKPTSFLGFLFCTAGVLIMTLWPHFATGEFKLASRGFGDLCAVLAMLTYGGYYATNRAFRKYDLALANDPALGSDLKRSLSLASIIYFVATLTSFTLMGIFHFNRTYPAQIPTFSALLALVGLGVIPTLIAHTVNQMVSRKAHPIWVSLMSPGETIVALVLGVFFMNQRLQGFEAMGGTMIFLGMVVTTWSESRSPS